MQVSKWGNSLAIRLPASVIEVLDLKEGDDIEIHVAGSHSLEIKKTPEIREILARLRAPLKIRSSKQNEARAKNGDAAYN